MAVAVIALAAPGVAWADEEVRSIETSFPTGGLAGVALDFPIGELNVLGFAGDEVEVEISFECDEDSSACRAHAERIDFESRTRNERLELWFDGYSKWRNRGLHLEMTVRVPRQLAVAIDMSIGELEISGLEGDLEADLGIGEVTLAMQEEVVSSVRMDAGIGETSLRTLARRKGSAGLFTREVVWDQGYGEARVRVEVGIGEVSIRLS